MVASTDVIVAISLLGAIGQALVTARWYEPPPKDDADPDHDPSPLFEAVLFFVLFGLVFAIVGYGLSAVATLVPPYSRIGLLVLTPLGFALSYAAVTGRLDANADRATTMMQGVGGVVVAAYPVAFLLV